MAHPHPAHTSNLRNGCFSVGCLFFNPSPFFHYFLHPVKTFLCDEWLVHSLVQLTLVSKHAIVKRVLQDRFYILRRQPLPIPCFKRKFSEAILTGTVLFKHLLYEGCTHRIRHNTLAETVIKIPRRCFYWDTPLPLLSDSSLSSHFQQAYQ